MKSFKNVFEDSFSTDNLCKQFGPRSGPTEILALLCAFLMGFYALGTRFQSRFLASKDTSWRVRKPNAKQNRFQIVTIFFYFSLQHIS